jgi:hypothetical protein
MSWASHWSNRHDLPDKILAAARGESYVSDEDDDDDEPELIRSTNRRPQYRDPTTEDEDDDDDGQSNKSEEGKQNDNDDDDDDDETIRHYNESQMGQKGEPFTEADLYMAAKHAAKYDRWLDMTSKDRWDPFTDQVSFFQLCSCISCRKFF